METKCCGTCKWYCHEDISDGWVCVNSDSASGTNVRWMIVGFASTVTANIAQTGRTTATAARNGRNDESL